MRVKILGKIWDVIWLPRWACFPNDRGGMESIVARGDKGVCEGPALKGKRIFLKNGLEEQDELETVVHELLHAADWQKDEEWVCQAGHDIAKVLYRMGWRRE